MRKLLISLSLLACMAQTSGPRIAMDSEQITVSTSAIGFTATKILHTSGPPANAVIAECTCECVSTAPCPLRFTNVSGTNPTSTVGEIVNVNSLIDNISVVTNGKDNITNFKAIRSGSNDVKLSCIYYR